MAVEVGNTEGTRFESITSFHRLHQIINEPTHILPSSSSCIDLMFINQPNSNRQWRASFTPPKRPLPDNICPPVYKHLVWNYSNANVEIINLAIESFNWENASDGKDMHARVALFDETLLNFLVNSYQTEKKLSQAVILLG